jgi:hypothetical protein
VGRVAGVSAGELSCSEDGGRVSELMESLCGVGLGFGAGVGEDGSAVAAGDGVEEGDGSFGGAEGRSFFVGCSGVGAGELSGR